MRVWPIAAVAALIAAPVVANAQVVRGSVVERGSGAPVSGAVVQMLDSTGVAVTRTITSLEGAYRLAAPRAGTYGLRVLRIGFQPSVPVRVTLQAGVDVTQPPLVAGASVSLDTVRVAARRECQLRPDAATATFTVWEQIRTALIATQITVDRRLITSLVAYERALDNRGERVLRQATALRAGIAGVPWRSISVDSLTKVGYAVTEPAGATTYFAPDLSVLVSEQFMAEHCLRLVAEDQRIGIAFEPTRSRRNVPEIEGTIWIDRASKELQSLDFKYVNVTRHEETLGGGHVEFARLRDGGWLISRWNIRAPVLETRYGAGGALREGNQVAGRIVREVQEEGGLLSLVRAGSDTLWMNPALFIAGSVLDSAGRGVGGARVSLRGTGTPARTDSAGRFRIEGVVPGSYIIEAQTDALAATGAREFAYVTLAEARSDVVLRVPSDAQVVAGTCPNLDPRRGMLGGEVRRMDSLPPADAMLTIEWEEFQTPTNEIIRRGRAVDASTDAQGFFHICDIPVNTALVIRAAAEGRETRADTVRLSPDNRFAFTSLRLTDEAATFVLAGRVLSDVDASPLENAEVSIPALGKRVMTAADGAFLIRDIAEGIQEINVRRLGYRLGRAWVTFGAARTVERNFVLGKATALDTIAVVAQRSMAEFEERKKMNLGTFLTRDQLAKQENFDLSTVLSRLSGMRLVRVGGAAYAASGRSLSDSFVLQQQFCAKLRFEGRTPDPPQDCACFAQVYLDNVLLYGAAGGETVPDINNIPVIAIEAMEYYSGPSQAPVQFNRLNSNCGILVIHTRRGD
jgi:hypothetical protein